MIIFGESFFKISSASYLFNLFKQFLSKNKKITDDWNPINILSVDASTVGNLDLDIVDNNNTLIEELNEKLNNMDKESISNNSLIFSCTKKSCKQMLNCEEAYFQYQQCGNTALDRDKDGIPCESICN